MALPDFFKRRPADDAGTGRAPRSMGTADSVEKVRTRARQRLIGAVVLLTVGVIGFPLLFESQPRPVSLDIPIEIPKPDGAPALTAPAARPDAVAASESTVASGVVTRDAPSEPMPAVQAEAASAPVPASAAAAVPAVTAVPEGAVAAVSTTPVAAAAMKPPVASAPAATVAPSTPAASAADRVPRFVVQVGAFTDPAAVRDVRAKMEKLGLKTYTQVADTTAGRRTRVRLGPFDSRAEADSVRARANKVGVAAVVLTL